MRDDKPKARYFPVHNASEILFRIGESWGGGFHYLERKAQLLARKIVLR